MSVHVGKRTTTQQESSIPSLQSLQIVADIYFILDSETSVCSKDAGSDMVQGA